jgi:hypothetical protein
MTTTTQIGIFTLDAEHDFSVPQEYAGACRLVRVPAGNYPIEERIGIQGRRYVGIHFAGTLILSSWHSSCQHRDERPMTHEVYGWSTPHAASESSYVVFGLDMLAKGIGSYTLAAKAA